MPRRTRFSDLVGGRLTLRLAAVGLALTVTAAGCLRSSGAASTPRSAPRSGGTVAKPESGIRDWTLASNGTQVNVAHGRELPVAAALLSADGHIVAFSTEAALRPDDIHDGADVYVANVRSGSVQLASIGPGGHAPDGRSLPIGLSADGSVLLFRSWAHNQADGAAAVPQLYLRDLRSGVTQLVSRSPQGRPARTIGRPADASLARDGRYVVFVASFGSDCGAYGVYLFDAARHGSTLVSRNADGAPTCRPQTPGCNVSGVPFDTPVVSDAATVIAYHQLTTGTRNPCASDGVIVHFERPSPPRARVVDRTSAMPGAAEDTSAVQWLTPSGRDIAVDIGEPHVLDLVSERATTLEQECNYTFPVALTPDARYAFWACQGFDAEYGDDPGLNRTDLATGNQLSVGSYLEDSPLRVSNLAGFSDDGRYVAFIDKHGHLYVRGPFPAS